MSSRHLPERSRTPDSLTLKLGTWFEAQATGWGIAAIPLLLALVALVALFRAGFLG